MKVDVDTAAGFSVSEPVTLFSGRYRTSYRDFDVSPDGTRFLMTRNAAPRTTERLHVLLNRLRLIEERLPPASR